MELMINYNHDEPKAIYGHAIGWVCESAAGSAYSTSPQSMLKKLPAIPCFWNAEDVKGWFFFRLKIK